MRHSDGYGPSLTKPRASFPSLGAILSINCSPVSLAQLFSFKQKTLSKFSVPSPRCAIQVFCFFFAANTSSSNSLKSQSSTSRAKTLVGPHEQCRAEPSTCRRLPAAAQDSRGRRWPGSGPGTARLAQGAPGAAPRCVAPTAENGAWNDHGEGGEGADSRPPGAAVSLGRAPSGSPWSGGAAAGRA